MLGIGWFKVAAYQSFLAYTGFLLPNPNPRHYSQISASCPGAKFKNYFFPKNFFTLSLIVLASVRVLNRLPAFNLAMSVAFPHHISLPTP